jgi:uncharacterized membrane protein YeaQ/YmgE (transglycosylase-associated protein family)
MNNTLGNILFYSVLANVLTWGLFGLAVGVIAYLLSPKNGGFLITITTGVLGSMIGGFLASLLFGTRITGIDLQSFIVALSGALIMVALQKSLVKGEG